MGILSFVGIRDSVSSIKSRLTEIESEIEALKVKRFEIVRQPLPFEDFVDWVCEQTDPIADYFIKVLKNNFLARDRQWRPYMEERPQGYDTMETFHSLYPIEGDPTRILHTNTGEWLPREAFYYLFRDQIKAGIRAAMEQAVKQEWPKKTGTKRSVRLQEIAKLDSAIEKLDEERHNIHDEIEGLGVKF